MDNSGVEPECQLAAAAVEVDDVDAAAGAESDFVSVFAGAADSLAVLPLRESVR